MNVQAGDLPVGRHALGDQLVRQVIGLPAPAGQDAAGDAPCRFVPRHTGREQLPDRPHLPRARPLVGVAHELKVVLRHLFATLA